MTLADDVEHRWLQAEDGTITFDLGGHTYQARHGGDGGLEIAYDNNLSADVVFKNGTLLTEWVRLAHSPSAGSVSAGSLTLSGVTWTNYDETTNSVYIGFTRGSGSLYIIDGSQATLHGGFRIGIGTTAEERQLVVSGPGTTLHASDNSFVERGSGATPFRIEDGAAVTIDGRLSVCRVTFPVAVVVDNATLTVDSVRLGMWSGDEAVMELRNGAVVNFISGSSRIAYNRDGTIIVHSGSTLNASGTTLLLAWTTAVRKGTLLVYDEGLAQASDVRLGHGGTTSMTTTYSDLLVHTGGLVQVSGTIHQETPNSIGFIEVRGNDPDRGGRARLEVNDFYLGTRVGWTAAWNHGVDLVIAEEGLVTVSNLFRVASTSTMTIDRGTVSAETLDMLVDEDGTAKLTVILSSGGTDTMITVSGEATVGEADFELALAEGFESEPGDIFTIIEADTLTGKFNGIEEGEVISVGDYYQFRASYVNDAFTLRTMPPPGTILMMY